MRIWTRKRLVSLGLAALAVMACAACAAEAPPTPAPTATPRDLPQSTISENSARIFLIAPAGDYQEGWADLTNTEQGLRVEIDVEPGEPLAQPAHIHRGDCQQLGDILYTLENIIGGESISVFEGVIIEDVATGDTAINLHRSFADFPTYTACGEIPELP